MTTYDPFAPRHEPARSVYEAFQHEAAKRKERTVQQWTDAEARAVLAAAQAKAAEMGLRAPTLPEVLEAERRGRGHIDYGAKWAYAVADLMKLPAPAA